MGVDKYSQKRKGASLNMVIPPCQPTIQWSILVLFIQSFSRNILYIIYMWENEREEDEKEKRKRQCVFVCHACNSFFSVSCVHHCVCAF